MDTSQWEHFIKMLESMQQQDKVLYKQLLLLRDNVRDLKTELRRERDECVRAMRDIHETSSSDGEAEGHDEALVSKRDEKTNRKHERQDSGISVRHSGEIVTSKDNIGTSGIPGKMSPVHHQKQDSGISVRNGAEMVTSRDNMGTSGMPGRTSPVHHQKQDSGISVRNGGEMVTSRDNMGTSGMPAKTSPVNLHKKQDSGILIDEEILNDTKILSRLVVESKTSKGLVKRPGYLHAGVTTPRRVDHNTNVVDYTKQTRPKYYANKDFVVSPLINHARTRSCPAVAPKPINYHSTAARAGPGERSASVVDMSKVTEENNNDLSSISSQHKPAHGRISAKSEPRLSIHDQPLHAVFVSAGEVNRPRTSPERPTPQVGPKSFHYQTSQKRQQTSPERQQTSPERQQTSPERRPTSQERPSGSGYFRVNRSQTMVEDRNSQQNWIYNNNNSGRMVRSISPSPSLQSFRIPHRTRMTSDQGVAYVGRTSTDVGRQRRNTMSTCHAPSKSWDGSIDETSKVRIIPNLYRSASQISLV